MPGRRFDFIKTESDERPADMESFRVFELNFQTALLLVLLQRGLLDQRQFDLCLEALKR